MQSVVLNILYALLPVEQTGTRDILLKLFLFLNNMDKIEIIKEIMEVIREYDGATSKRMHDEMMNIIEKRIFLKFGILPEELHEEKGMCHYNGRLSHG